MRARVPSCADADAAVCEDDPDWSDFEEASEEALDLVQQLLRKDPARRPSTKQIREHPWIAKAASLSVKRALSMRGVESAAAAAAAGQGDSQERQCRRLSAPALFADAKGTVFPDTPSNKKDQKSEVVDLEISPRSLDGGMR